MKLTKYYVYSHLDGEEVVYIGLGSKCRVFSLARDKEHVKWLQSKGCDLKYKINFRSDVRSECLAFEKKLINKLKPKFNKMNNPNFYRVAHNRKFSDKQIISIRNKYKNGYSLRRLGREFNACHARTIKPIVLNILYRNI